MTLANQQAFPSFVETKCDDGTDDFAPRQGMTLRQHIAIEAMKGILASPEPFSHDEAGTAAETWPEIAKCAVQMADALLAELERKA